MIKAKKNILINLVILIPIILFSYNINAYTYQEGLSAYEDGNKAKAFRIWYLLSLENNPNADYGLGILYLNGFEELNKNTTKALEYLNRAEKANIVDAIYQLAIMYEIGNGVSQNNKKAFNYYLKASKDDHLPSLLKLADSYDNGTLSPPDSMKACELWNEVANFSNIEGYYNTALCLKYSKAGVQDFNKAIQYLKLSGDIGITELFLADFSSIEIKCDWHEALKSKDEIIGTFELASCYRNGEGREINQIKARKLYEETIKDNEFYLINESRLELARMYLQGAGGNKEITFADNLLEQIINSTNADNEIHMMAVKTRAEIVFGWSQCKEQLEKMNYSEKTKQICLQAAKNNEHCALLEVIKHYKNGTGGFEKDLTESKKWQNILNNLIGIAKSPQSGFGGKLKKCDN